MIKHNSSSKQKGYHFISQDPVDAVLVQRDHPVEPSDLIVTHFSILDV